MALPAPRTVRHAVTVWYPSGTGATALASFLAAFIALPLSVPLPGCRFHPLISTGMSGVSPAIPPWPPPRRLRSNTDADGRLAPFRVRGGCGISPHERGVLA